MYRSSVKIINKKCLGEKKMEAIILMHLYFLSTQWLETAVLNTEAKNSLCEGY